MWAHYASRHKGVCFVLENAALSNQLAKVFPNDGIAALVAYVTGIDPDDWSGILDLDEVESLGVAAAVDKHVLRHIDRLVFTKNDDWNMEREWRCCVLAQPPSGTIELSLEGVVGGIVAGLDLPESGLRELQYVNDAFGIQSNVARTYIHQLNMIDIVPIDTSTSSSWRYYTRADLQTLGYL